MTPPPPQIPREWDREYLLDMINQLAKLAREAGETEVAILLKAILDVVDEADRRRVS